MANRSRQDGWMIVDAHCDLLYAASEQGRDIASRDAGGQSDLPRLQAAGVGLVFMAVFSDPAYGVHGFTHRALEAIDRYWQAAEVHSDLLRPVLWREDLAALGDGPVGGLLSLEGGEPLRGDPALLRVFHRLGVRALGLTWNGRNELADGVGEGVTKGGLTRAGRAVLAEAQRLGIVVDVAHLSEAGFWDVLEHSTAPVIASHANARRLCDHPRNLWDDQMDALARGGGVIGVTAVPAFLRVGGEKTSIDDIVRHITYLVDRVGVDHVAIGTDFDGIETTPEGFADVTAFPTLTQSLLQAGYSDAEARRIMGGNLVELLKKLLPSRPRSA